MEAMSEESSDMTAGASGADKRISLVCAGIAALMSKPRIFFDRTGSVGSVDPDLRF